MRWLVVKPKEKKSKATDADPPQAEAPGVAESPQTAFGGGGLAAKDGTGVEHSEADALQKKEIKKGEPIGSPFLLNIQSISNRHGVATRSECCGQRLRRVRFC